MIYVIIIIIETILSKQYNLVKLILHSQGKRDGACHVSEFCLIKLNVNVL